MWLWTIFSRILPGTGSKDIGRQLLMSVKSPLLGMGITLAADQAVGKMPLLREQRNSSTTSGNKKIRASLSTTEFIPSTPDDLDVSMLWSKSRTKIPSIMIVMTPNETSCDFLSLFNSNYYLARFLRYSPLKAHTLPRNHCPQKYLQMYRRRSNYKPPLQVGWRLNRLPISQQ